MDAPASPEALRELEALAGLGAKERALGWRIGLVAQVGYATTGERVAMEPSSARRIGAALLALRSERIQPGVNAEESAPAPYQERQGDGRLGCAHRAGGPRWAHTPSRTSPASTATARESCCWRRIDVLTPGGKDRLRAVRTQLAEVTDRVVKEIPLWADLPTGRALSRNAARGRKAFALAGQRIYVGGLLPPRRRGLGASLRLRGARVRRGGGPKRAGGGKLSGTTEIPAGCDLLAGVCLMAGPVNQNGIRKQFHGASDLLAEAHPDRDPTSLLVWTLKAKTVADPIGNEQQLLDASRKGALVDLRPGPHEGGLAAPRSAAHADAIARREAQRRAGPSATWATSVSAPMAGRSRATAARRGPPRGRRR